MDDVLIRIDAGELGDPLPVLAYLAGQAVEHRRRSAERRSSPGLAARRSRGRSAPRPRRRRPRCQVARRRSAHGGTARAAGPRDRRSRACACATCRPRGRRRSFSRPTSISPGACSRSPCLRRSWANDAGGRGGQTRRHRVHVARVRRRRGRCRRLRARGRGSPGHARRRSCSRRSSRWPTASSRCSSSRPTASSTCARRGSGELAGKAEAERATGYVVGGISPLGQRRRLPTTVDASVFEWDTVLVSAGRRGLQIELAPGDLVRLTDAHVAGIAR